MRDLINQLDTLNNTLSNVSVVRDEPDDAAAAPTTNVLSTPHIALIKQLANRHGWTTVEFEELFCEAKFEKVREQATSFSTIYDDLNVSTNRMAMRLNGVGVTKMATSNQPTNSP